MCKKNQKQYNFENKESIIKYQKEYREKNRQKANLYALEYRSKNREKIRIGDEKRRTTFKRKEYLRLKLKEDINFKISCNLRNRIRKVLKGNNKSLNTMFLIGCDIDYLMYHLQSKFTEGMSWDNHGDWRIDHIKPCAKFDLSKPNEQRKCFNYTNLQPLWAIDNLRKGNK